jgi:predicted  nucleic acid-binding Zn-ribbon protein
MKRSFVHREEEPEAPAKRMNFGEPISLVDIADDGSMSLNAEAERMLRDCSDAPLMVVCVVGRSRTGKSFMLNRILMGLQGARGFKVSPSTRACTKGLWIPGAPIPSHVFWEAIGVPHDSPQPYNVLVVDTEGINALDRDQSYDMRIFTLALLLSSVFVFNSLGAIDETAVSTLSAVASVAESLTAATSRSSRRYEPAGRAHPLDLPSLLWAVRDFSLDIESEGEVQAAASDDEYLESVLSSGSHASSKGMLRSTLVKAFPHRLCQMMVRPAEKEEDMKRLQDLSDDLLRPEFVAAMKSFRSKLYRLARIKHVGNVPVDGNTLCDLLKLYLVAVNSDRVPVVTDAWTQVTQQRIDRAVRDAISPLEQLMLLDPVPDAVSLYFKITHALRSAESHFSAHAFDSQTRADFDRQLQQRVIVALKTLMIRCKEASGTPVLGRLDLGVSFSASSSLGFVDGILGELRSMVESLLCGPSSNSKEVALMLELELAQKGNAQAEVDLEKMRAMWTEANRSVIDRETQISALQEKVAALQSELQGAGDAPPCPAPLHAQHEELLRQHEDTLRQHKTKMSMYEDQLDELDGKLAEVERERNRYRDEKERLALEIETCQRSMAQLKEDLARLRDQLGAKALEVTKLVEDHGQARLEWATRLRESETMAARAQGTSEAMAARLQGMDTLADTLQTVRAKLREQELDNAVLGEKRKAAEEQLRGIKKEMEEKETQLFDGLRTLREMQRVLRR